MTIHHPEYASRGGAGASRTLPNPQPAEPSDARLLGARLEMYFADCFKLRRQLAQAGAAAEDGASSSMRLSVQPASKLEDPRDGELTCAQDRPFIKFLHFVGTIIVADRGRSGSEDGARRSVRQRSRKKKR